MTAPRRSTRRAFLRRALAGPAALGLGPMAFGQLLAGDGGRPHHAPRARRIVWLMQNGGPSHVDLFDDKPVLRLRLCTHFPYSSCFCAWPRCMKAGLCPWR